uniref:Putative secreted protein n=1 Tax=Anopheles marajoara TaxID=58244 RepID=A0A2M4C6E1_9DIPT
MRSAPMSAIWVFCFAQPRIASTESRIETAEMLSNTICLTTTATSVWSARGLTGFPFSLTSSSRTHPSAWLRGREMVNINSVYRVHECAHMAFAQPVTVAVRLTIASTKEGGSARVLFDEKRVKLVEIRRPHRTVHFPVGLVQLVGQVVPQFQASGSPLGWYFPAFLLADRTGVYDRCLG